MDQAYTSSRRSLLTDYRNSETVRSLIDRGMLELDAIRRAAIVQSGSVTALVRTAAASAQSARLE